MKLLTCLSLVVSLVSTQDSTSRDDDQLCELSNSTHPYLDTSPPEHHEMIAGLCLPRLPNRAPLHTHTTLVDQYWRDYKVVHSKAYIIRSLEARRKRQWLENLIRIHHHNEAARNGQHSYYLRANHLSDLNVREYIKEMAKLSRHDKFHYLAQSLLSTSHPSPTNTTFPEEWNWVEEGFVTPAWDQKRCGSCYAFSIASSAQGQHFAKTKQLVNLSVQQIVDCSVLNGNMGCHGGSIKNSLQYLQLVGGLAADTAYPYKAKQQLCHYAPRSNVVKVTGFVTLPSDDEAAIQRAVATSGPVACAINASPHTFQLYHKGIYDDPSCSSSHVNHAMLIVGYTKEAWILKNWWGSHWGQHGYMLLRRGQHRCAVGKYAGYPVI